MRAYHTHRTAKGNREKNRRTGEEWRGTGGRSDGQFVDQTVIVKIGDGNTRRCPVAIGHLEALLLEVSHQLEHGIVGRAGLDARVLSVAAEDDGLVALGNDNTTSALLALEDITITAQGNVLDATGVHATSAERGSILEGGNKGLGLSGRHGEVLGIRVGPGNAIETAQGGVRHVLGVDESGSVCCPAGHCVCVGVLGVLIKKRRKNSRMFSIGQRV